MNKSGNADGEGGKGDGKRPDPKPKIQKVKDVGGASSSAPSGPASSALPNPGSPPSTCGSDQLEGSNQDALKHVLDEAQRMLRGMSIQGEKSKEADLVEALRKILGTPSNPTMKAVSVARVQAGSNGLLDTGATHALRPRPGENLERYGQVQVSLAAGGRLTLRMTEGQALVHVDEGVEPIVPVGRLIKDLGCNLEWEGDHCRLLHPLRGLIDVDLVEGCPMVAYAEALALALIQELEESNSRMALRCHVFADEGIHTNWLDQVVRDFPVFQNMPQRIRDKLVDTPARDLSGLQVNRRIRRRWEREGVTLHLYAGPKEGYYLQRAVKEMGGDPTRIFEVDIVRDKSHNMVADDGIFAILLDVHGWMGGWNIGRSQLSDKVDLEAPATCENAWAIEDHHAPMGASAYQRG